MAGKTVCQFGRSQPNWYVPGTGFLLQSDENFSAVLKYYHAHDTYKILACAGCKIACVPP